MAFESDGNIFVTDMSNHRIQKFLLLTDLEGRCISKEKQLKISLQNVRCHGCGCGCGGCVGVGVGVAVAVGEEKEKTFTLTPTHLHPPPIIIYWQQQKKENDSD